MVKHLAPGPPTRRQRTSILAPAVLQPHPGDTVTLECVVTEHPTPPPYFTWYIRGSALDFALHRGGLQLAEEFRGRSSASRLTLTRLEEGDSGEYTCSPAGAPNATVTVTVTVRRTRSFFSSSALLLPRLPLSLLLPLLLALHRIQ